MPLKLSLISIFCSILLYGCSNEKPNNEKIIGKWVNPDRAELIFKSDRTFIAKFVSSQLFWRSFAGSKTFSGSGIWGINEGQSNWEISLDFTKNSNKT